MTPLALLAPALLAAAASAAEPGTIEAHLIQAKASVAEIGRVLEAAGSDPLQAEKACRESFSVDSLTEGLRIVKVPAAAVSVLPALRAGLVAHLTCKALADDEPSACGALEPLAVLPAARPYALPPHYVCRRDYHLWSYDLSRIAGRPDLYRRCMEENAYRWPGDESPFRPDAYERVCRLVEGNRAGKMPAEEACARLAPSFASPVSPEECARRVRWFYGEDAAICAGLGRGYVHDRCLDLAALRRAHAGGTAAACGDSASCRLLMSRPPDCAPALESARTAYCGRFNLGYASLLHAELSVLLERAAELVAQDSPQRGPPHPLAAILAELETRRHDLARAVGRDMGAPVLPGESFAEVDSVLARAHTLALSLELAGSTVTCRGEFSLPALVGEIAGGKLAAGAELMDPIVSYTACQALVLDGSGVCRSLDVPAFKDARARRPDYLCRHLFLMWRSDLERLSGGPEAGAYCVAENYHRWRDPFDGGPFKPGAFRDGCEILSEYSVRGADLRQACGRVMPYYRYSRDVGECVDRIRYAHGEDARLCRTLENPRPRLDRCLDLVALRKALREGASCGDSAYCAMQLKRGPEACAPYLAAARRASCGVARASPAGEPERPAQLLDRARRLLDELRGVPAGALARRRSFLAWVTRRLDVSTSRIP